MVKNNVFKIKNECLKRNMVMLHATEHGNKAWRVMAKDKNDNLVIFVCYFNLFGKFYMYND